MKKFLSVILTLIMVFTVCAPVVFAEDEQKNYLMLGDSIAAGLGLEHRTRNAYGAIVAYNNDYGYKNDAVSGHTSKQLILRLSNPQVACDVKKADIISISIGGNDFLMDNLAKILREAQNGNFEPISKICKKYKKNLETILSKIRNLNADAVILLQNLYNPRTDDLREVYGKGIELLNGAIGSFTAEHKQDGVLLVDLEAKMKNFDSSYFQADQVHPSAKGHQTIAQGVQDVLFENGISQRQTIEIVETEPSPAEALFDKIIFFFRRLIGKLMNIGKAAQ